MSHHGTSTTVPRFTFFTWNLSDRNFALWARLYQRILQEALDIFVFKQKHNLGFSESALGPKFRAPKLFRHRSCDEFLRGSSLIFSLLVNVGFRGGLRLPVKKMLEKLVTMRLRGTTNAEWKSIVLPFLMKCPVVSCHTLTKFPSRKHCGSFFKKRSIDEQVQFFDIHHGFFSRLDRAVRRHHHHRTS